MCLDFTSPLLEIFPSPVCIYVYIGFERPLQPNKKRFDARENLEVRRKIDGLPRRQRTGHAPYEAAHTTYVFPTQQRFFQESHTHPLVSSPAIGSASSFGATALPIHFLIGCLFLLKNSWPRDLIGSSEKGILPTCSTTIPTCAFHSRLLRLSS